MLSTKSEQFLVELRMYLLQRRKKDEDINGIVEELEVHLMEAENKGENIDNIIGKSRKQYMKSIWKELLIDKEGVFVLIPAAILAIVTYTCFAPDIRENFKISQNILLFGSLPLFLILTLFTITLFKGIPKVYPSIKIPLLLIMLATFIAFGVGGGFYFWMNEQLNTNYFLATTMRIYSITTVCILSFIMFTLSRKS